MENNYKEQFKDALKKAGVPEGMIFPDGMIPPNGLFPNNKK